jgi:preprotein translocase subunit SecD
MRKFLYVVVFLSLLAAGVGAFVYWRSPQVPDITKLGGTFLVFETDGDLPDTAGPPGELASAVRRRLDPTGREGITARSAGAGRIEVGVPRTPRHDELIEAIPKLLVQKGKLEFLIIANREDDAPAIKEAERLLRSAEGKEELAKCAPSKEAPPPPRNGRGEREFKVDIPGSGAHSYRWAPLSTGEVASLRLDPASLKTPDGQLRQEALEKGLLGGEPISPPPFPRGLVYASRAADDSEPTFFVLVREPNAGEEVTGDFLRDARVVKQPKQGPRIAIDFTFNTEGGNRFFELTNQNQPTGTLSDTPFHRSLAIVLDGKVITAPTLRTPIRDRGEITGNFTEAETEEMVRILRAGALPVRFKPEPVSRTTRAPGP